MRPRKALEPRRSLAYTFSGLSQSTSFTHSPHERSTCATVEPGLAWSRQLRLDDCQESPARPLVYDYIVELDAVEGRVAKTFASYGGLYRVGTSCRRMKMASAGKFSPSQRRTTKGGPNSFCMRSTSQ
jgi:hypothetical protein